MDEKFYKDLWQTVKIEKKPFSGEITNKRKNGERYIAFSTISPVLDENGELKFFVGEKRDITKEKNIDRMKTDFISLASHQLKTPLSAMRWFAEMLLDGDAGKLTKEQYSMVENIDLSNKRMIALVNGLLNVSRIESGRIIIEPQPTNIPEIIKQLEDELKLSIEKKELSIIFKKPNDLQKINVDPSLVREVYRNLLTNAVKYSKQGGSIKILLVVKGDELISQVTDDGIGIPEKDQSRIFERFHRANNAVKSDTDGTGLGLYMCQLIVEAWRGKIWFESREDKGTTFWFTLPLTGMRAKKGEVKLGENTIAKNDS